MRLAIIQILALLTMCSFTACRSAMPVDLEHDIHTEYSGIDDALPEISMDDMPEPSAGQKILKELTNPKPTWWIFGDATWYFTFGH